MKNLVLGIMCGCLICFVGLFAIDVEVARNEYLEAKAQNLPEVQDCIFDMNCERYNKLLRG